MRNYSNFKKGSKVKNIITATAKFWIQLTLLTISLFWVYWIGVIGCKLLLLVPSSWSMNKLGLLLFEKGIKYSWSFYLILGTIFIAVICTVLTAVIQFIQIINKK